MYSLILTDHIAKEDPNSLELLSKVPSYLVEIEDYLRKRDAPVNNLPLNIFAASFLFSFEN
jgi:hypothetical protein